MISNRYDQANVVTDLQGLESLRKGARSDDPEALKEVAKQFEALMVQMIMKNARQSNELLSKDGLFDSEQVRFYQQMFDEQMAVNITQKGSFGLADVLVRQMSRDVHTSEGNSRQPAVLTLQDMLDRGSRMPASRYDPELMQEVRAKYAAKRAEKAEAEAEADRLTKDLMSPADFVSTLYPYARKVGQELGVNPEVMLSQAALETGWGQYMIRDDAGRNSFNLFGIKADSRWHGDSAVVSTLEYRGGVAQKEKAAFRAYGNYEESLRDYAGFLKSNPRYTDALKKAHDPVAFTQALQDAGYATDPEYAKKIQRIMDSPVMALALGQKSMP